MAAKVNPTLAPPSNPIDSQPLPIAYACPGPKANPKGRWRPKAGWILGRKSRVIRSPKMACDAYPKSISADMPSTLPLDRDPLILGGEDLSDMLMKEMFKR